jgi:hypothetical protein
MTGQPHTQVGDTAAHTPASSNASASENAGGAPSTEGEAGERSSSPLVQQRTPDAEGDFDEKDDEPSAAIP